MWSIWCCLGIFVESSHKAEVTFSSWINTTYDTLLAIQILPVDCFGHGKGDWEGLCMYRDVLVLYSTKYDQSNYHKQI